MPIVIVEFFEGRTSEQKARLAKAITDAMVEIAGAKAENVTVIFHDLPKTNLAKAGVLASEQKR
ncbi:tautomerase family protein [Candidatus Bathyarchaeota archaeon]|nr:tautomerase family protein [Candidatus Bathyarchaeota archaeon]